jgi:hypothetical protein
LSPNLIELLEEVRLAEFDFRRPDVIAWSDAGPYRRAWIARQMEAHVRLTIARERLRRATSSDQRPVPPTPPRSPREPVRSSGRPATHTATIEATGSPEGERGLKAPVVLDPVSELRKRGLPKQSALVEYLLKHSGKAPFDDVKHHVHGDKFVGDAAVRKRVSETQKSLVVIGSPLKIHTASGVVYLDESPE